MSSVDARDRKINSLEGFMAQSSALQIIEYYAGSAKLL